MKTINAVDLFCGGGGTTQGLVGACDAAGYKVHLTAINHWDIAIKTHSRNHTFATHMCESVDQVNPRDLFKPGELDLLLASPECRHHSKAKGSLPINDQSRSTAHCVTRWVEATLPSGMLCENVPEFLAWGPLIRKRVNGQLQWVADPKRKGETFLSWVALLRSLGYNVDWKVLNAADYGDPTSRPRLFIQAQRGNRPCVWPEPTHSKTGGVDLFCSMKPWVPAREIIDWSLQGESIFNRRRPLRPNTIARLMAGLKKFSGLPFVSSMEHTKAENARVFSVDGTIPTITSRDCWDLIEPQITPFLVDFYGEREGQDPRVRTVDQPLGVVTTQERMGLVEGNSFLVKYYLGSDSVSIDEPLPAVTSNYEHFGVANSKFIIPVNHGAGDLRSHSLDVPMPTITSVDAWALIESYLVRYYDAYEQARLAKSESGKNNNSPKRGRDTRPKVDGRELDPFLVLMKGCSTVQSIDKPMPTLTSIPHVGVVQPFLLNYHGSHQGMTDGDRRVQSVDHPLPSLDTSNRCAVVEPFLVKFYGTGIAKSIDETLDTITANDRFGLVIPQMGAILDITFRMLQPHELSRAMGFPKTYFFCGNRRDKVRQIGNAVAVNMSQALCSALIGPRSTRSHNSGRRLTNAA